MLLILQKLVPHLLPSLTIPFSWLCSLVCAGNMVSWERKLVRCSKYWLYYCGSLFRFCFPYNGKCRWLLIPQKPVPHLLSSLATPFLFSLACAGSMASWDRKPVRGGKYWLCYHGSFSVLFSLQW